VANSPHGASTQTPFSGDALKRTRGFFEMIFIPFDRLAIVTSLDLETGRSRLLSSVDPQLKWYQRR